MNKWIKVIMEPEELAQLILSSEPNSIHVDYDESSGTDVLWIEDESENIRGVCIP